MKHGSLLLICLLVVVSPALIAGGVHAADDEAAPQLVPGNSRLGAALFFSKGCATCHSLPGDTRTKILPVLGDMQRQHLTGGKPLTGAEIAARLWNHGPAMWSTMAEVLFQKTPFTKTEMADLFAFLYYLGLLDPPGDAEKGRWLIEKKGCANCHAMDLEETDSNLWSISYWSDHTDPIRLASEMWNHASDMQAQIIRKLDYWPELEETDMADIVAFVLTVNPIAEKKDIHFGDQVRGRQLFRVKRCADCHRESRGDGGVGPSIPELKGVAHSVGGLGAMMWNHFPKMNAMTHRTQFKWASLEPDEMADMIAFLFSVGYFDEVGDPSKGREIFVSKRCSTCHEGPNSRGGNIRLPGGSSSFVSIAVAMWNHGPVMMASIKRAGLEWPTLTREQVVDLAAYLETGDGRR
jgi:cytochrome c2